MVRLLNMKKGIKMNIKFNNMQESFRLHAFMETQDVVYINYTDMDENLSGFIIYEQDGTVYKDCSDFIYRYNVSDNDSQLIGYTYKANFNKTKEEKNPIFSQENIIQNSVLSNEELTTCVANLMYETSLIKLGIEV